MKKPALTAKEFQHLAPIDTRYEVPAGPPVGLYVVVQPSGTKSWALRYRWHGQTRKLTLKEGMTLAQARADAQAKLDDLDDGIDPAAVKAEEAIVEPTSVKAVADEWLKRKMKGKASHDEVKRILEKDVLPEWKHKVITDIDRPAILRLLDATVDRGAPVLANRIHTIIKRWLKWCVMYGYIDHSPAAVLTAPSEEESRDRVLAEDELAAIWTAAPALGFPFGDYFRMLILTGQRRGEVANMKWGDVELENENPLWTLPRASTKSRRIHDVAISLPALSLLKGLPRFKPNPKQPDLGRYLFTTTSGERPISGFSKAKTLLDKKIEEQRESQKFRDPGKSDKSRVLPNSADLPKPAKLPEWHIHDIRRTMTTWMADHDVAPHVLAAILNHSPGSTLGITAVYARSKWAKEKREALSAWSRYVVSLGEKKKEVRRVREA